MKTPRSPNKESSVHPAHPRPKEFQTPSSMSLARRFHLIANQVTLILERPRPTKSKEHFADIRWAGIPLDYTGPRFGVIEIPKGPGSCAQLLLVAEGLRRAPSYLLDWVLWREAILEHLCRRIRMVPEAADLGLYGGLKYGIKNPHHRRHLQRLWETLSPPQDYHFYRYEPTVGFEVFDKVVDGAFLQKVIAWLNMLCSDGSSPLSSRTFTAALERWMMETHRTLNETEVRILSLLSEAPSISQSQLAKRLKISQASVNQSLRKLATTHLLRLYSCVNVPLIGLRHLAVFFRSPRYHLLHELKDQLVKLRYALAARDVADSILMSEFLLPNRHITQFRRWINQLCRSWGLPPPSIRFVTSLLLSRNFRLYKPDIGWHTDFWPILDLVQRVISGELYNAAPPLQTFSYSRPNAKNLPLRLHPWDFIYLRRATGMSSLTDKVSSRLAWEAQKLGPSRSVHMRYRRRVRMLEKLGVSVPIGFGLLNVGLDAVIYILTPPSSEWTERILRACKMLPYIHAFIFDDGSGFAVLLVPNHVAVDVQFSLRKVFAECKINAVVTARPAWQAFSMPRSPINPDNYDFEKGEWIWTQETLPEFQPGQPPSI